jgi:hypothetical protein
LSLIFIASDYLDNFFDMRRFDFAQIGIMFFERLAKNFPLDGWLELD